MTSMASPPAPPGYEPFVIAVPGGSGRQSAKQHRLLICQRCAAVVPHAAPAVELHGQFHAALDQLVASLTQVSYAVQATTVGPFAGPQAEHTPATAAAVEATVDEPAVDVPMAAEFAPVEDPRGGLDEGFEVEPQASTPLQEATSTPAGSAPVELDALEGDLPPLAAIATVSPQAVPMVTRPAFAVTPMPSPLSGVGPRSAPVPPPVTAATGGYVPAVPSPGELPPVSLAHPLHVDALAETIRQQYDLGNAPAPVSITSLSPEATLDPTTMGQFDPDDGAPLSFDDHLSGFLAPGADDEPLPPESDMVGLVPPTV
jgi:hypothetical protein